MYWSRTGDPAGDILLAAFLLAGSVGGWLLVRAGFRLPAKGRALVGVALGLSLSTWLANLLSHWILPPASFWLSAGGILLAGAVAAWRRGGSWKEAAEDFKPWLLWAALAAAAFLFFRMGRGLAIFDDRKNLSLISTIAAGDIPPHFYMNPDFLFSYHYGFQLFGASLMSIGGLLPWSAFDLAKALSAALAIGLTVLWGKRTTGRWGVGVTLGVVVLLAGGARWLLLFVPAHLLAEASRGLALWGSAGHTSSTLPGALQSPWVIGGGPAFPIPFAYVNGILEPLILYLQTGPISTGMTALLLILILVPNVGPRWGWGAIVALLSFLALAAEAWFVLLAVGIAGACLILVLRPSRPDARRMLPWLLGSVVLGSLVALVQGGTLTEVTRHLLFRDAASGPPLTGLAGFTLRSAPAIVSSHLGELRLDRPGELMIGLAELGAAVVFIPFAAWMVARATRRGRVIVLALGLSTVLGFLVPMVIRYDVDRDITRMSQFALLGWILLGFVPLALGWAHRGTVGRVAIAAFLIVLVFGGVVVTGSLLTAFPEEVFTEDFRSADATMARQTWDRLAPGSLVIDSQPWRAVAITGRLTRSSSDSTTALPEWESLVKDPTVGRLVAAGYAYAYVDTRWWSRMSDAERASFQAECVREVAAVHDDGSNGERWVYDLRACPPD